MDLTFFDRICGSTLIPAAKEMTTEYVIAVVLTGLSVVFLGLVILILFVWAFGKIFTRKKTGPAKPEQTKTPEPVAKAVSVPAKTENENQDEIVAVIAAAVAAMGASEGKNYRVKSVKAVKNKPSRSAWSLAGIQNNTEPF